MPYPKPTRIHPGIISHSIGEEKAQMMCDLAAAELLLSTVRMPIPVMQTEKKRHR
jgi:hypothetical protein